MASKVENYEIPLIVCLEGFRLSTLWKKSLSASAEGRAPIGMESNMRIFFCGWGFLNNCNRITLVIRGFINPFTPIVDISRPNTMDGRVHSALKGLSTDAAVYMRSGHTETITILQKLYSNNIRWCPFLWKLQNTSLKKSNWIIYLCLWLRNVYNN